jgi:hypothetical protein
MAPGGAERDFLESEGRRIAATLESTHSALVIGDDPNVAAIVAVAIARAEAGRRHVALGDLVGELTALYAIAGGEDAIGLAECFRDGLPLNDIARPAPDADSLFILPSGAPPVATEDILGNDRWPRLIGGFRQAGALLLLIAAPGTPGLELLAAAVDGVVIAGDRAGTLGRYRVLAQVAAPPLPSALPVEKTARPRTRPRLLAALAIVAAGAVAWVAYSGDAAAWVRRAGATASTDARAAAPAVVTPAPSAAPVRPDTVVLTDPSIPTDTISTAYFAVEVIAANTLPGANSVLRDNAESASLPAPTIAPVQLGGGTLWYKVVVGAWHDRAGADALLGEMRDKGIVSRDAGAVVRVPYALLLADGVPQANVAAMIDTWRGRGITAYALRQDDGGIRIFAGAFETAAQAASLAASVRDAGAGAVLAFRTGRTF